MVVEANAQWADASATGDNEALALIDAVRARLARRHVRGPADVGVLDMELARLGSQLRVRALEQMIAAPAAASAFLDQISEVDVLRGRLRERDFIERVEVLAQIRASMHRLYQCKTAERLIEAAPRELCHTCGFSRALISRVHGLRWMPEVYASDRTDDRLRHWLEHTEIRLDRMLVERELLRRRVPVLVTDPQQDRRTFAELMERSQTAAYVAAPIVPNGRPIGFFHADRVGDVPVTAEDRDNLWAFAEHFGLLYHRAVLTERLSRQRLELHEALEDAERAIEELHGTELGLARVTSSSLPAASGAPPRQAAESRLDTLLTRREREVLGLMTGGATNIGIAGQLVISQGTVKSHVKHILRKLRAGNRAEAVARYLQMLSRERQRATR
jgi:LuxR family transcriptional regulator, regulator of acetate metabolism